MKKLIALMMALVMMVSLALPVFAQAPTARNINIHRIDGDDVSLSQGLGREMTPRSGQRLSEGNILSTGWDTQVYLSLDADAIIKMDESSRLKVGSSRARLTLSLQSGAALVEVAQQQLNHSLETRVGNTSIAVRVTSYIIGRRAEDVVFIVMISGNGEVTIQGADGYVQEVVLPAGAMMFVFDVFEDTADDDELEQEIVEQTYIIIYRLELDLMGLFEIEEIYYRRDVLLEAELLTPEQYEELPGLLEALLIEREEHREAQVDELDEFVRRPLSDDVIVQSPSYGLQETGGNGGENGNGDPNGGGPEPNPPQPPEMIPMRPPGSGTSTDPFRVFWQQHLLWMGSSDVYEEGYHFRMTADLTLPDELDTIGGTVYMQLDGDDHTLTVNRGFPNPQIFNSLGMGSLVEDLNIVGTVVENNFQPDAGFTGGFLAAFNDGTVRNVNVSVNVTIGSSTSVPFTHIFGGIIGDNRGIIENSNFDGSISFNFFIGIGSVYVGGIVGGNWGGIVRNVQVSGDIYTILGSAGGVAGSNTGEIEGVIASNIAINGSIAGGIAGSTGGSIENSIAYNLRVVGSGANSVAGGIAGFASGVISTSSFSGEVMSVVDAGGITGRALPGSTIANAHAHAVVITQTATNANAGGIAGWSLGSAFENSYFTGIVSGNSLGVGGAGGIVGNLGSGSSSINNVSLATSVTSMGFNNGRITGLYFTGLQPATLQNNHALSTMLVNGDPITTGTLTNQHGQDVTSANFTTIEFWRDVVGFDFITTWEWSPVAGLPILQSLTYTYLPVAPLMELLDFSMLLLEDECYCEYGEECTCGYEIVCACVYYEYCACVPNVDYLYDDGEYYDLEYGEDDTCLVEEADCADNSLKEEDKDYPAKSEDDEDQDGETEDGYEDEPLDDDEGDYVIGSDDCYFGQLAWRWHYSTNFSTCAETGSLSSGGRMNI